jgi:hypothetical protein
MTDTGIAADRPSQDPVVITSLRAFDRLCCDVRRSAIVHHDNTGEASKV